MKSQTALIRTDCAVELNTKAAVNLNIAVIVNPRNSESYNSFRFNQSFNKTCLFVLGMSLYNRLK